MSFWRAGIVLRTHPHKPQTEPASSTTVNLLYQKEGSKRQNLGCREIEGFYKEGPARARTGIVSNMANGMGQELQAPGGLTSKGWGGIDEHRLCEEEEVLRENNGEPI